MPSSVAIELNLPGDLRQFKLPKGVNARLQSLLDKQDNGSPLSRAERIEAEGLVNIVEMLQFLKLRAKRASRGPSKS